MTYLVESVYDSAVKTGNAAGIALLGWGQACASPKLSETLSVAHRKYCLNINSISYAIKGAQAMFLPRMKLKQWAPILMGLVVFPAILTSEVAAQLIVVTDSDNIEIEHNSLASVSPNTTFPKAAAGDLKTLTYRIYNDSPAPLHITSTSLDPYYPGGFSVYYSQPPDSLIEPFGSTEATVVLEAESTGLYYIGVGINSDSLINPWYGITLHAEVMAESVPQADLDVKFQTNLKARVNPKTGLLDVQVKALASNIGTRISANDYVLFFVTPMAYKDESAAEVGIISAKKLVLARPGKLAKVRKLKHKFSTSLKTGTLYMAIIPGDHGDSDWSSNVVSMFYTPEI